MGLEIMRLEITGFGIMGFDVEHGVVEPTIGPIVEPRIGPDIETNVKPEITPGPKTRNGQEVGSDEYCETVETPVKRTSDNKR